MNILMKICIHELQTLLEFVIMEFSFSEFTIKGLNGGRLKNSKSSRLRVCTHSKELKNKKCTCITATYSYIHCIYNILLHTLGLVNFEVICLKLLFFFMFTLWKLPVKLIWKIQ